MVPVRWSPSVTLSTRRDQATKVHWRPAALPLVPKFREEWPYPPLELLLPLRVLLVHRAPYGAHLATDGKVFGGVVLVSLAV